MTEQFINMRDHNPTGKELKGGVVCVKDGPAFMVAGPEFTDLQSSDDFAFGDSLEEAEQTYWNGRVKKLEIDLVHDTKELIRASDRLKSAKEIWEKENFPIIEDHTERKAEAENTEEQLKAAAVRLFELTGDKKPSLYAEIKEKAGALVYDTGKAIEWCRENMKAAINEVLNTKAFESFSGAEDLEFVTKTDPVPTAQIARKKLAETVGD